MSDLQELFESEGVEDAEDLLSWASERATNLVDQLGDDPELSALLVDGGTAGDPVPVAPSHLPGSESPAADEVTQPRARIKPEPAPLPPIPSKARVAEAEEEEEEIEELDIEELDVEELELIEDEDEDEEGNEDGEEAPAAPDASEADVPPGPSEPPSSFGPPDGTDEVPEWKAALMSAQTDDEQAAARVKEASSAEPLPEAPIAEEERGLAGRLEAEDDEISQHSMDFSDLDTDDE